VEKKGENPKMNYNPPFTGDETFCEWDMVDINKAFQGGGAADYDGGLTIMQYTELKDKNDKEIYEGDIVQLDVSPYGMDKIEVVKYENGGVYPFAIAGWECTPMPKEVEVIGNVYENSDLLNNHEN
jgi:hypothetical protein